MNRGTVIEFEKGIAVVLTPDGQFLRIKASGVSVGEEITWADSDRAGGRRFGSGLRKWRRVYAAASAAALILLFFALWAMKPSAVVAYVSMDINPSLELGLDKRERVLELRAVDAEAEAVVQGILYRGEPVEDVMREIGERLASSEYLGSGNEEIVIASVRVRSVDEEWESQVTEKIKQVLHQASTPASASEAAEVKIETVSLPPEIRKEAMENGISTGKMAIWLAAEKSGRSLPLEEVQQQSVKSISSSIGGIRQVLEESSGGKDNKVDWKQLLKEQKRKQQKKEQSKQEKEEQKQQKEERRQQVKEEREQEKAQRKQEQEERKQQEKQERDRKKEQRKREQEERKQQEKEERGQKQEERKQTKAEQEKQQRNQEKHQREKEKEKEKQQRKQEKEERKQEQDKRTGVNKDRE